MPIDISKFELKARAKTEVTLNLQDEEKGYTEEKLTVYHKLLFDDGLINELLLEEKVTDVELPLVTRHLLLIDAQCMGTTDAEGKWAKWTPATLKIMGEPVQTEIHTQIFAPLLDVLRRSRPVPSVPRDVVAFPVDEPKPSAAGDESAEEREEVLPL